MNREKQRKKYVCLSLETYGSNFLTQVTRIVSERKASNELAVLPIFRKDTSTRYLFAVVLDTLIEHFCWPVFAFDLTTCMTHPLALLPR